MIAYDLQCLNGHVFEGWFDDEPAYKSQQKKGLISCPVCNEERVSRIPSTFSIRSSPNGPRPSTDGEDLEQITRQIVHFVEKNFDDVGPQFASEALKIHYGAAEPRNIRGVSTKQEEETLRKEGITFFKIPMPQPPDSDA